MPPPADLAGCTIVFDLDGTLVDSAPDLPRALNTVLAELALPPAPLSAVRRLVGLGARRLIERATSVHGLSLDTQELGRLTDRYVEVYAADIASLTTIFPGVFETLDWLRASGAKLSVCTNKRTSLSRPLLTALNLAPRFEDILGADAVINRKPHPDHFRAAVTAADGEIASSMMVGDSAPDVDSAKAAGAPVAIVDFGYTETAPALLGADAVFSHYAELPDIVLRLLNRS